MAEAIVRSFTPQQILLDVSKSICAHTTLRGLLDDLKQSLEPLIRFEALTLALYHPERETARLHAVVKSMVGDEASGIRLAAMMNQELPVDATPVGEALRTGEPVYVPDIDD